MKSLLHNRVCEYSVHEVLPGEPLHLKDSVGAKEGSMLIQEAYRRDEQSQDVVSWRVDQQRHKAITPAEIGGEDCR